MTQPASEGRPNAEYRLIGTGERFRNADGTSRQAELASCRPGDAVALVREPDNPRDPMAIALISARGVQLGYIRREDARWLAQEMDDGREARAVVHDVRSRSRPGSPLSIALSVSVSPA